MPKSKGTIAMEQAFEELRFQFVQFQQEVLKSREEEAERNQRKEANMQDLIVETIISQLKSVKDQISQAVHAELDDRMSKLELGCDKGKKGRIPEEEEGVQTPLTVTAIRHRQTDRVHEEGEIQRREFRGPLPRAELPYFNGDNPLEWIRKCAIYFEIHQVPEEYKTPYATLYFKERADDWYGGYLMEHDPPPWLVLVELVKRRFQKKGARSAVDEFKRLHQVGQVEEYMDKFEQAKSRLLMENRHLTESFFVEVYISGLREEIQPLVRAFKPEQLPDAFELSLYVESASESQCKKMKGPVKGFNTGYTQNPRVNTEKTKMLTLKPNNAGIGTRNALMEQRRALGQCFKCGEKYYPGHQCKLKIHMLEENDEDDEDVKQLEEVEDENSLIQTEEAVVSMHATSGNPNLKTMKFKGQIGKRAVYALMDSGSTHSFVDPAVLQGLKCNIIKTMPMIVMVANGDKMVTDSKCTDLSFSLQGNEFHGELRLLNITGYDMILGLDGLSQVGPMKINWAKRWISFEKGGKEIKLQVQPEQAVVQMCQATELEKELKNGSEIIVAHIMLIQGEKKKSLRY